MKNIALLVVLSVVFVVGQAFGQIPSELYYENFYEPDEDISLVIRIYTNATDGDYLYEDSNTVTVANGAFSTRIGDNTTFGTLTNALALGRVFLEVTINGVTFTNREQVLPEAYALRAVEVPDASITSSKIASNAVLGTHIAAGTVGVDQLAENVVSIDKLAPDVFQANDDRYINVDGDTMAGPLSMGTNGFTAYSGTILAFVTDRITGLGHGMLIPANSSSSSTGITFYASCWGYHTLYYALGGFYNNTNRIFDQGNFSTANVYAAISARLATNDATYLALQTNTLLKSGDIMSGTLTLNAATALTTTGNVGIGAASPTNQLQVDGVAQMTGIRITGTSSSHIEPQGDISMGSYAQE